MMKAFILLNEAKKHSWIFIIRREILLKEILIWFYCWWNYFDAELDILSKPINDLSSKLMEVNPAIQRIHLRKMIQGQNLVFYFSNCSIPWI